ncbi:MAG TPA: hypothetical protein VFQ61_02340 [Polyangiaceae bacterium]|nr:hypothetical protein [Polyangiaceae bacterium]
MNTSGTMLRLCVLTLSVLWGSPNSGLAALSSARAVVTQGAPSLEVTSASERGHAAQKSLSDDAIRDILIRDSIASYSGNCPCPYSTARNGSRCGKRSAWNRAGGAQPLCFRTDVSAEMVQRYRESNR